MDVRPNPQRYRELAQPFPNVDAVDAALRAFFDDLEQVRAKHKIADVFCVVSVSCAASDFPGGEASVMITMHFGDALRASVLAAYGAGYEEARMRGRWSMPRPTGSAGASARKRRDRLHRGAEPPDTQRRTVVGKTSIQWTDASWNPVTGCNGPPDLHWVIVGGESGANARPMDLAWARSLVAQCREAGVACFVKQLGANIRGLKKDGIDHDAISAILGSTYHLRDRKGGDPSEWPADLRVREFPR